MKYFINHEKEKLNTSYERAGVIGVTPFPVILDSLDKRILESFCSRVLKENGRDISQYDAIALFENGWNHPIRIVPLRKISA